MTRELLLSVNEWVIALVLLVLLLLGAEVGFRRGCRVHPKSNEAVITQVATLCGAIIGLLALLLAFTFAMALSRNDVRRELVVEEANAIGAVYLRADLLPEPERSEIKGLLRQYVDDRLDFYSAGADENKLEEVNQRTLQLQNSLWALVPSVLQKDDRTSTSGLFVESLNDVINFHTKRFAAMENHVPQGIFFLLFAVALMSALAVGYGSGIGKNRHRLPTTMLCVIVVLVIAVIMDLDRPRRGLIRIPQDSMLRLRDEFSKDAS
jgi:MFS superfamily sulfate permease-like transporter